jgi:uncharacterized OB-fold protein
MRPYGGCTAGVLTAMTSPSRPTPLITDLTRPFWDATKQGRLAIQRCGACGYYNHPPRPACDRCQSTNLAFEDVFGRGAVWTFTVMHQKSVAGFEETVPYVTALVELDEQPMLLMVTNLPGMASEDVKIGMRVRVTFEALDDGSMLPQFVPDTPARGDRQGRPSSPSPPAGRGPGGGVS